MAATVTADRTPHTWQCPELCRSWVAFGDCHHRDSYQDTRPEWLRRRDAAGLPAVDMTYSTNRSAFERSRDLTAEREAAMTDRQPTICAGDTPTVDITPTWRGIVDGLADVIRNAEDTPTGRQARNDAHVELRRMAELADRYVAGQYHAPDGHNAGRGSFDGPVTSDDQNFGAR